MKRLRKEFDLLLQLTKSNFKLRTEGSYLGILWYLLNPLLMFLVMDFIFGKRLGSSIEHYPLYLLLGLITFSFINMTTMSAMKNIMANSLLIKSMNFNRNALITSGVLLGLISHFFELLVFFFFLLFFGVKPVYIIFYPLLLILQYFFSLGLSLILSSLVIYFRDLENIWSFVTRVWWFATPIFYSIDKDSGLIYSLNMFNPMYHFIDIARGLLIYSRLPGLKPVIMLIVLSLGTYVIGSLVFNRLKTKFAELT